MPTTAVKWWEVTLLGELLPAHVVNVMDSRERPRFHVLVDVLDCDVLVDLLDGLLDIDMSAVEMLADRTSLLIPGVGFQIVLSEMGGGRP